MLKTIANDFFEKSKNKLTNYFQLSHALQRQKTLFDNVNIDWNLSHDEGSTDFSDDETIIEDRVSAST